MKTFKQNQLNKEYLEKIMIQKFNKKFGYTSKTPFEIEHIGEIDEIFDYVTIRINWKKPYINSYEAKWLENFFNDNNIYVTADLYKLTIIGTIRFERNKEAQ